MTRRMAQKDRLRGKTDLNPHVIEPEEHIMYMVKPIKVVTTEYVMFLSMFNNSIYAEVTFNV